MAQSKDLESSHYVSQTQIAENCSFALLKVVLLLLSVDAGTHSCNVPVPCPVPRSPLFSFLFNILRSFFIILYFWVSFKLLFLVKRLINDFTICYHTNFAMAQCISPITEIISSWGANTI